MILSSQTMSRTFERTVSKCKVEIMCDLNMKKLGWNKKFDERWWFSRVVFSFSSFKIISTKFLHTFNSLVRWNVDTEEWVEGMCHQIMIKVIKKTFITGSKLCRELSLVNLMSNWDCDFSDLYCLSIQRKEGKNLFTKSTCFMFYSLRELGENETATELQVETSNIMRV